MATAKETKLKTIQHLLYELGYAPDDKIPLRNVVNTSVAAEHDILPLRAGESSEFMSESSYNYKGSENDASSLKQAKNLLRKSKSEREAAKGKKKKSRVKSFTNILLGRKHSGNKLKGPLPTRAEAGNYVYDQNQRKNLSSGIYDPEHTENRPTFHTKNDDIVKHKTYEPQPTESSNKPISTEKFEESLEVPEISTEDKLRDTVFALSHKVCSELFINIGPYTCI